LWESRTPPDFFVKWPPRAAEKRLLGGLFALSSNQPSGRVAAAKPRVVETGADPRVEVVGTGEHETKEQERIA
jgi:hypothetical protein